MSKSSVINKLNVSLGVVQVEDGVFEVKGAGGDTNFGGNDLDKLLLESLLFYWIETGEFMAVILVSIRYSERRFLCNL